MLTASPALAADRTWNGGGGDDNWSTAANWGGTAPVANDRPIFAGSTRLTPNNDIGTGPEFAGIRFNAAAAAFTISGSNVRLGGNIDFSANPSDAITQTFNIGFILTHNRTITTQTNGAIVVGGSITDGGNNRIVTKAGEGALTLNGVNNFSGQVRINTGTMNVNTLANAGAGSSLGRGTAAPVIRIGNTSTGASLVYTGAAAAASTDRQIQVGTGIASGDTGGASIANNVADSAHTVTFSNNVAFNAPQIDATAARTLTLGGTNTGLNTISGAIADNVSATGKISLQKSDAGTWVLAGANTYTGPTAVIAGILLVNGSLGDTAVTVANGATLGGSGTVGTSAVLNTLPVNGTLAPGNSTGILTINDNLDLNGSLSMELNGTSAGAGHDQVRVNGAVDITGSTLAGSFGTFTPANGNILFIVLNDGTDAITGTFSGFAQNATVANYGGFIWKISYIANSAANTFIGGNDVALLAIPDPHPPVILSSWTFDSGATSNARLASSNTASGLTVSQLNFHPTFDVLPPSEIDVQTTLNALSIHDRWAADSGIGIIRVRRADYLHGVAPSGRSATFDSTNTSISGAAGTLGASIWFSVSTDSQTSATIHALAIANPGGPPGTSTPTYHFSKSGDPLGTGVSDEQPTIYLSTPITLAANETVLFSINMDSAGVATNHNLAKIDLLGATEVLPPAIGLVTSTLTVGAPHGTYNRLSATLNPGPLGASSDTSDLTGTIKITVNINPNTGKTALLTLSEGDVNGTNMSFVKTVPFVPLLSYNILATNLSAEVKTVTPPGTVDPNTGVFAANQHSFILNQGSFDGTAATQTVEYDLSPTRTLSGAGTGNGSLTLTPAGTAGPYNLFTADVILPVAVNQTILISGVNTVISSNGTIKATGQIQMPSSEFNAWMITQGATSFVPTADTAGNGAPDAIKWALGLSLFDNPLPFLLKPVPSASGTFMIALPPGGTVAPLTVESSTSLLPGSWTTLPAGQIAPSVNPIPAGTTGVIGITPAAAGKLFLRLRAEP